MLYLLKKIHEGLPISEGVVAVLLENIIHSFITEKNCHPLHTNQLLDFAQKSYLHGDLSIVEYKKIYCELDKLNAEKPQSFIINTKLPFNFLSISS